MNSPASSAASRPTISCAPPGTADEIDGAALAESLLLNKVVMPALGAAENAFSAALARINVEDLAHSAQGLGRVPGEA